MKRLSPLLIVLLTVNLFACDDTSADGVIPRDTGTSSNSDEPDADQPDADPQPPPSFAYDESAYSDFIDPDTQYQLPLDDDGWAEITPGADHQIIYVSNAGDDGHDGLTPETAVATLEEARGRLRAGTSDWLLLRRGDTFSTDIRFREELSGESADHPMVVGAYGDGPRPVIDGSLRMWATHRHVVLRDLEIHQPGKFALDVLGTIENLYLENLLLRGGESRIQGDGSDPHRGITLRRSMILDGHHPEPYAGDDWSDAHANRLSGIYIANVDGLLVEENFADLNGWLPGYDPDGAPGPHPPSMFNHNFYLQTSNTNLTYRGNISSRGASFGAQLRPGGVVQYNLFVANNAAFFTNTVASLVEDNVITIAGNKDAHTIGALGWGYNANDIADTYLRRLIVAHSVDPLGPEPDQDRANNAVHELDGVHLEDVILYQWGSTPNQPDELPGHLDPASTSLASYAEAHLGSASTESLLDELRLRDRDFWPLYLTAPEIIHFFQEGFGIEL